MLENHSLKWFFSASFQILRLLHFFMCFFFLSSILLATTCLVSVAQDPKLLFASLLVQNQTWFSPPHSSPTVWRQRITAKLAVPTFHRPHEPRDRVAVVRRLFCCALQMLGDIMKELPWGLITLILGNQTVLFSRASAQVKLQAFISQ